MDNLGSLNIDLTDDEALQEYFSRKEVGGTCKFIIEASLNEVAGKKADLKLTAVTVKDYEEPGEAASDAGAEPDAAALTLSEGDSPAVRLAKSRKVEDGE